ncbi:MAG TPA: FecR family protein [Candidatus Acidoferrum sp.]|nr:FecR family protein [Candidatus Acidoferrum sp.]
MCTIRHRLVSGTLGAILLLPPIFAQAQQPTAPSGIGVVTAIQGQATVSRQARPDPASLRFKDDVFFRDQIITKERSSVRLLLGGKGVLTVREQSQVTLDETVAPDGGRRSVLSLLAGKIGAAIARTLMRPGEEIEVRTPNAVAAVRGTVLIAEYIPPKQSAEAPKPVLLASSEPGPFLAQAQGASGGQSNFFVLSGSVTITPLGQPPVTVGAMQSLQVTATPGGVQAGAVQNITPAQAAQAAQGLDAAKPHTGEAEGSANVQAQAEIAAAVASTIVETLTGEPATTTTTGGPAIPAVPPVPLRPRPLR